MAQLVELPDGSQVEFPDGMSREDMSAAVQRYLAKDSPTAHPAEQTTSSPPSSISQESLDRAAEADQMALIQMRTDRHLSNDKLAGIKKRQDNFVKQRNFDNAVMEGLTFGLVGDEARAGMQSMFNGGSYEDRLKTERDQEAEFRSENPAAANTASILSAATPGALGAKLMKNAADKIGKVGAGAVAGATAGGSASFMEGEGAADRAIDGVLGLGIGGLVGGLAPKVIDGLSNIPVRVTHAFRRSAERPTTGSLQAAKNAAYKAVDESGEVFSGQEMKALFKNVRQAFDDAHYVEEVDTAAMAVLRNLERRQNGPTTLSQLDRLRQNMWSRYNRAGDQPEILDAIHAIDSLIDTHAGSSEMMAVARAANSRFAKSQLLENAFQKASDQTAATGSGGNLVNKYRQAVTSIINDPKRARFFDEGEITLMRGFVQGTSGENFARRIGKLAPSSGGLSMFLNLLAAGGSGGATLVGSAIGESAKAIAEKKALNGAGKIQDAVAGRAKDALSLPQRPLNPLASAAITGQSSSMPQTTDEIQSSLRLRQMQPHR